jgi:hypothetical protein
MSSLPNGIVVQQLLYCMLLGYVTVPCGRVVCNRMLVEVDFGYLRLGGSKGNTNFDRSPWLLRE